MLHAVLCTCTGTYVCVIRVWTYTEMSWNCEWAEFFVSICAIIMLLLLLFLGFFSLVLSIWDLVLSIIDHTKIVHNISFLLCFICYHWIILYLIIHLIHAFFFVCSSPIFSNTFIRKKYYKLTNWRIEMFVYLLNLC